MNNINIRDSDGKLTNSYRRWAGVMARCYNPKHPAYPYYGERGIEVCSRWRGKGGHDNFFADMGAPPEGLTLDRINNDGNYEPSNCRWATWKEQAANRRRSGPPKDPNSLRQQAIKAGLPYHVVYQRVMILCWPLEKALSTPIQPRGRQIGWRKEKRTL